MEESCNFYFFCLLQSFELFDEDILIQLILNSHSSLQDHPLFAFTLIYGYTHTPSTLSTFPSLSFWDVNAALLLQFYYKPWGSWWKLELNGTGRKHEFSHFLRIVGPTLSIVVVLQLLFYHRCWRNLSWEIPTGRYLFNAYTWEIV